MKYVLCDYARLNHDINKHHKRADQVLDPAEAMMRDVPLDLKSYKKLADNQLYRLFHYPLRALLCNPEDKLNYDPLYPNLDFGPATNETICEGFKRYFYKDMDLSNLSRLPVTIEEVEDRRSIVSHFKPTYCSACWRTFKQTEAQRQYQTRPLCDKCEPQLRAISAQLKQELKKVDEKQDLVWKQCVKCMDLCDKHYAQQLEMMRLSRRGCSKQLEALKTKGCTGGDNDCTSCITHCKKCKNGHFEECNKCSNMLCGVRGDRFMVDKKHSHLERRIANVDHLVDIEECERQ